METAEYSPQLADLAGTGTADANAQDAEEPVAMQVRLVHKSSDTFETLKNNGSMGGEQKVALSLRHSPHVVVLLLLLVIAHRSRQLPTSSVKIET